MSGTPGEQAIWRQLQQSQGQGQGGSYQARLLAWNTCRQSVELEQARQQRDKVAAPEPDRVAQLEARVAALEAKLDLLLELVGKLSKPE